MEKIIIPRQNTIKRTQLKYSFLIQVKKKATIHGNPPHENTGYKLDLST